MFATDLDERAIGTARTGLYPESIVTDVPPARLRQFFVKEDQHYRVRKEIREKCCSPGTTCCPIRRSRKST